MKRKRFAFTEVPIPLSYDDGDIPNIHRIVDLISAKELSGWRFAQALKFSAGADGYFRPTAVKFRRPKRGRLRTIIFDYMTVTVANDGLKPDSEPGWEKVGVIEYDALKRPRTILFRKENHDI